MINNIEQQKKKPIESEKSLLLEFWNSFFPLYFEKTLDCFKLKNKNSFNKELLDSFTIKDFYKNNEEKNDINKNESENKEISADDNNEEEKTGDDDIFREIQKFISFNSNNNNLENIENQLNNNYLLKDYDLNYNINQYSNINNIKAIKTIPSPNFEKRVFNYNNYPIINNEYLDNNINPYPQILEKYSYDNNYQNKNNELFYHNQYNQYFFHEMNNQRFNSPMYPLKCVNPPMSFNTPVAPPNFVHPTFIPTNNLLNNSYDNYNNYQYYPLLKYPSDNNFINNNNTKLLSKKSSFLDNFKSNNKKNNSNNNSISPDLKNNNNKKKIYIKNNKLVYVINENHTNVGDAINLDEENDNNKNQISNDDKIDMIKKKLEEERKPRSSKFRGVSKNGGRWQVLIMIKQKKRYIGNFSDETEAAREYDKIAIQFHGLKAKTNFEYTEEEIKNIINSPKLKKLAYLY